jgi:hypothetical protein
VESPFSAHIFAGADAETQRVARDLERDGFAVIDFPDPEIGRIADSIKANLNNRFDWDFWFKTGHSVGAGLRLQDAWQFDANVKRIACNEKVIALLSRLYGRRAWPFQTLNFPVGTQQHYHTDSVHFSSIPERFMCGVWTALEDIDEDRGPLVYYPGSHSGRSSQTSTSAFARATRTEASIRVRLSRCGKRWSSSRESSPTISSRKKARR